MASASDSGSGSGSGSSGGGADHAAFREQSLSALKGLTRATNQLTAQDLAFHRSLDQSVGPAVDEQAQRILGIANGLLRCVTGGASGASTKSTATKKTKAPYLTDEESVEDNWRGIVDTIDELLEKADACLDEFTGLIKKAPSNITSAAALESGESAAAFPSSYSRSTSTISKPQLQFDIPPDNTPTSTPWKPLLTSKPHATVSSFEQSLQRRGTGSDILESYPHPYDAEIRQARYPSSVYTVAEPISYTPFATTTATFVDTWAGVEAMLAQLRRATEVAVDLEHHDTHSYTGLVCLMQLSTRDGDWIVDTLQPWRTRLEVLNEVFADPRVLKVFHGAFMDMIWLQRDLGIYVVNLFDTFHAANALAYPKKSLKYLLAKHAGFHAEKQYQMADWRLRPLLPGMFDYARSDTHYLLYIYDLLRNELVEKSDPPGSGSLVDYVAEKSKAEALQRYERPLYDAMTRDGENHGEGRGSVGWFDLLLKTSVLLSKEQFAVFRAVHRWRDEVARAEDEGTNYVLAKHALFRIAHAMPTDAVALLRAAAPVSPVLRAHVLELVEIIRAARAAGGPELRDVLHPTAGLIGGSEAAPEQVITTAEPTPHRISVEPTLATRAERSQFWGAIDKPEPALINIHSVDSALEAFVHVFPLPMPASGGDGAVLAVDTQAHPPPTEVLATARPAVVEPHLQQDTTGQEKGDRPERPGDMAKHEVFTLKELQRKSALSKKRKLTSEAEGERDNEGVDNTSAAVNAANEDRETASAASLEADIPSEQAGAVATTSSASSKNQRKRRRQAEKRLARQQLALLQQQSGEEGRLEAHSSVPVASAAASASAADAKVSTTAPFDYTTAPSVLHAASATDASPKAANGAIAGHEHRKTSRKDKEKKGFNPYAKALNTGTGLATATTTSTSTMMLTNIPQSSPLASWSDHKEKILRGPYDYLVQQPGKDIRRQFIEAFNGWLRVPDASLQIITQVVVMLHTASLLVDDVEDSSVLRRGVPVAHNIFGTAQTINSANYVYFLALQEVMQLRNPAAIDVFTQELLNLHRGQGMDLFWRDTLNCPTEEDYLEMVGNKCGGLFRLAVKLMQAESAVDIDCVPLVNTMGLIFQICDDYLNLSSPMYISNKGLCEDLTEGKFSFPIIHSIRSNPTDQQLLNILKQRTRDVEVKKYAVNYMRSTGSFAYTRARVRQLADLATQIIRDIEERVDGSECNKGCTREAGSAAAAQVQAMLKKMTDATLSDELVQQPPPAAANVSEAPVHSPVPAPDAGSRHDVLNHPR
ncbi:exosome nuclease subunit [Ascosphaera acerosa]|nr:exosome nuclease subunit [Ascosphaera acerosa]